MMKKLLFIFLFFSCLVSYGQVGIGTETPDASAALEILSTEKGLLISRMSESQKLAIRRNGTSRDLYSRLRD